MHTALVVLLVAGGAGSSPPSGSSVATYSDWNGESGSQGGDLLLGGPVSSNEGNMNGKTLSNSPSSSGGSASYPDWDGQPASKGGDPLIGDPAMANEAVHDGTFAAGFDLYAAVLSVVAVVGFFNPRKFHIPDAVTLALAGLLVSLVLIIVDRFILPKSEDSATGVITDFCRNELVKSQFSSLMLNYFLGFLFFANAIECDVPSLAAKWRFVLALSVVGVIISTALIGTGTWLVFLAVGLREQNMAHFLRCLLFGVIITPTDAHKFLIAFLEKAGAPTTLLAKIVGEALFNDAAVVILFTVVKLIIDGESVDGLGIQVLLLTEVVGGLLLGVFVGFVVARAMRLVKARRTLCVLLSVVVVFDLVVVCACVSVALALRCAANIPPPLPAHPSCACCAEGRSRSRVHSLTPSRRRTRIHSFRTPRARSLARSLLLLLLLLQPRARLRAPRLRRGRSRRRSSRGVFLFTVTF